MGDLKDDVLEGLCCSHCGTYFISEHGYPVLCADCWDSEDKEERGGLQKAHIKELSS